MLLSFLRTRRFASRMIVRTLYAPSAISFGKMLGAFGLLCALLSNRAMALPSDLRGLRGLLIVLALS